MNSPRLYVVAAPSGGGKTSLIKALLENEAQIRLSVSHTTRAPRPGERDGVHYHFVDTETFENLIRRQEFLEHARVFGNYYGTGRTAVERQLEAGCNVILDIDWQGARQIRSTFPSCRTIFIVPPSLEALRQRLVARGQDSEEVVQRRMQAAQDEISHWDEFDYVIINDDFGQALADLRSIVRSGVTESQRQPDEITECLAELLGNR